MNTHARSSIIKIQLPYDMTSHLRAILCNVIILLTTRDLHIQM